MEAGIPYGLPVQEGIQTVLFHPGTIASEDQILRSFYIEAIQWDTIAHVRKHVHRMSPCLADVLALFRIDPQSCNSKGGLHIIQHILGSRHTFVQKWPDRRHT